MIRKILYCLLLLLSVPATASLAGCNTVDGVGKDISRGGRELSEEAREHSK